MAASLALRPAVMSAMARHAPVEKHVRAFALLRLAANLGIGVGPAVGGFLALYSYRWLFVADAATCWMASAVLWWCLRDVAADARIEDQRLRLQAARQQRRLEVMERFFAVLLASINVFGGFLVTNRMLAMFSRKKSGGRR